MSMTPIAILFSTPLKRFLREKVLLGNAPSWELLAILSIYFVQGVLGLSRLAVSFFLKDELGLSPAAMGALIGLGDRKSVV